MSLVKLQILQNLWILSDKSEWQLTTRKIHTESITYIVDSIHYSLATKLRSMQGVCIPKCNWRLTPYISSFIWGWDRILMRGSNPLLPLVSKVIRLPSRGLRFCYFTKSKGRKTCRRRRIPQMQADTPINQGWKKSS